MIARSLIALALVGCGDDDVASDAAPDTLSPIAIEAPMPPAPPDFGECLPGYHGGGLVPCRAYVDGPHDCALTEAHFPGEPDCAPIGSPCAADGWPIGLAADAIYVRTGATSGDGSQARPYGSLAEALEHAEPGATIGLHAGPNAGARIEQRVEIIGACALRTVVGSLEIAADDVVVRNVFAVSDGVPILIEPGASARIEDVGIEDSPVGLRIASGARAVVRTLLVRHAFDRLGRPALGSCIEVGMGGSLDLERAFLDDCANVGLYLDGGDGTKLARVHVRGGDHPAARGLQVSRGSIEGRGLSFEGVHVAAVVVTGDSAAIDLDQIEVDTVEVGTGTEVGAARGLAVQGGAVATLSRSSIRHVPEVAVFVDDAGSTLRAHDVALDGSLRAISAQRGGAVSIERATVANSTEFALFASQFSRMLVHDLRATSGSDPGAGVRSQLRAVVVLERAELEGFAGAGAVATSGSFTASDLRVFDVHPIADGYGHGIVAQSSALTLTRTVVDGTYEAGVMVRGMGSTLEARHLDVRNSRARVCDEAACTGGAALLAIEEASVTVDHFAFSDAALCATLIAFDGRMDLHHGTIDGAPFGVCMQVPGYDLARLSDDVRFRSVGAPLAATDLPIPDPYSDLE